MKKEMSHKDDGRRKKTKTKNKKRGKKARCNAAKRWTLTWNNYPENWEDIFEQKKPFIKKYCIGTEVSKTGTPHLQGWVMFHDKQRPVEYLKISTLIHWEVMRAKETVNNTYCTKENGKIVTHNVSLPYKMNIELRPWQQKTADILKEPPNDRDIHWIWEPSGATGKTIFQKWVVSHMKETIVLCSKASDMKYAIVAYQKKHESLPTRILINVPRCTETEFLSWQGIEEVKDMLFFSPKYESDMICGPSPHVMIFANEPPPWSKMSQDRWKVWTIDNNDDLQPFNPSIFQHTQASSSTTSRL